MCVSGCGLEPQALACLAQLLILLCHLLNRTWGQTQVTRTFQLGPAMHPLPANAMASLAQLTLYPSNINPWPKRGNLSNKFQICTQAAALLACAATGFLTDILDTPPGLYMDPKFWPNPLGYLIQSWFDLTWLGSWPCALPDLLDLELGTLDGLPGFFMLNWHTPLRPHLLFLTPRWPPDLTAYAPAWLCEWGGTEAVYKDLLTDCLAYWLLQVGFAPWRATQPVLPNEPVFKPQTNKKTQQNPSALPQALGWQCFDFGPSTAV